MKLLAVFQVSPSRYRFSIDDNSFFLRDITQKRYKSIFDCFYLNILRNLHREYGAKFVLNIYYTTGDDWKLTASADTREGPVKDLFSNFLDKSPQALLRRIDPDYYYPTFGDDSSIEETAPTLGKFYVKLNQRENHALWGNFRVAYVDNELEGVGRQVTYYIYSVDTNGNVSAASTMTLNLPVDAVEPPQLNLY